MKLGNLAKLPPDRWVETLRNADPEELEKKLDGEARELAGEMPDGAWPKALTCMGKDDQIAAQQAAALGRLEADPGTQADPLGTRKAMADASATAGMKAEDPESLLREMFGEEEAGELLRNAEPGAVEAAQRQAEQRIRSSEQPDRGRAGARNPAERQEAMDAVAKSALARSTELRVDRAPAESEKAPLAARLRRGFGWLFGPGPRARLLRALLVVMIALAFAAYANDSAASWP